jgi:hypothetical protein
MDHLFEFLESPEGIELTHAVIILLLAIASYITWLTKRRTDENAKQLNSHLEQHIMGAAHTTSGVVESDNDDI